jgi:hypothetical protein
MNSTVSEYQVYKMLNDFQLQTSIIEKCNESYRRSTSSDIREEKESLSGYNTNNNTVNMIRVYYSLLCIVLRVIF